MAIVEEQPEAAYGPLHALVPVKGGCMLLYGHVGEVDEGVGDVLTLHAEAAVGEACKATPASRPPQTQHMQYESADTACNA